MAIAHDISELGGDYLYERIRHSLLYRSKDSLTELKAFVDKHFIYTAEQWEFVEVQFDFDLEDRYDR